MLTGPDIANRPVLVAAVRTPIGRRGGVLAGYKAVELLRLTQVEVLRRAGVEAAEVDQVIGGCVTQVGEQSLNVTRNAWLSTGLPPGVGCTTVDTSCGSAQQANHLVTALIAAGEIDVGIACGVESMSRVALGSNLTAVRGHYKTADYPWDDPPRAQFGGAERIAARDGITRAEADAYGVRSQALARRAVDAGRFDAEIVPVGGVRADEGLRDTTAEGLARLTPLVEGGVHTAGSTSQQSDGAAALLWTSASRARAAGLTPLARLVGQVTVGADPYYLLDGPIAATGKVLARTGLSLRDVDRYEVNEAFAAVVLAWRRRFRPDPERLNVNGGAIALGHPLGASGARLLVSAVHELHRADAEFALVTMCCGGSQGTASLVQRV
ncbi:steroid 3-ketoacyl-CoA thiolase [Actinosynnema sp. NPDC020468]|uniref:steroid 3-ketoacyl-CoA thiolase n=1 Tax=Actinosynnema sp. NPDC020468 TaxID=3154488 RepID=UPI00340637A9